VEGTTLLIPFALGGFWPSVAGILMVYRNKNKQERRDFWYFMLAIVPLTIMLTWVYNQNQRSILGAVLLHFMYNFSLGMVYPLSQNTNLLHVVFMYIIAIGLVATGSQVIKCVQPGLES
jgi:membrane protease YdiL (CAAX protease family)